LNKERRHDLYVTAFFVCMINGLACSRRVCNFDWRRAVSTRIRFLFIQEIVCGKAFRRLAPKLRGMVFPARRSGFLPIHIEGATMNALPNTRDAIGDSLNSTGRRARRIARHGRHAAEDIATELRLLMSELEETLAEGTSADAAALRTQMRKKLDAARARLDGTREAVRERAEVMMADADNYVHENAWKTIVIVGAIALIAGALLGRSNSR
jgi:ElaB/YqjD/DUF883 family membrane-anchored ribosome-binding protein